VGSNGPETISRLREAAPEARILALTRENDEVGRDYLRGAGADACLPIWQLRDGLARAVKELLEPDAARRIVKTILCIEDDAEMIDLIRFILRRHSFRTVATLGGHKALDAVLRVKPDLVLLDLMMPDVSGWDVYREMKAHEDTKDIPIIVVTVIEPHWSKKRGLDPEDVEGYLVKPFLPRALVDQVSRTVGQAAG
jgi:DNA-binding response OmpR family regulator